MFRKIIQSLAGLAILLTISAGSVLASAKMEVPLGQSVTLQSEALKSGGNYKWVAKKGNDIITTQAGSIFTYIFDTQGEYEVNLNVTESSGNIKSTTVNIIVGDRYSKPPAGSVVSGGGIDSPLKANYLTLPIQNAQKEVNIIGDEGRVVFDIGTRTDILEYRVDRNIFIDSDGNGTANDDIDNSADSSYLLGGIWETEYKASESNKVVAEITVVNSAGQKAKSQIKIIFNKTPDKEGDVVAILDSLPVMSSEDNKIYVYDEKYTVAFYSRRSQGDPVEYRIDKNIFIDSDGDGNPANDIDNKNHDSFKTGDVWLTDYTNTGQQIISQLIVVGRAGTGSRIQREIIFTNRPASAVIPTGDLSAISLMADKDFVQKGDPILFSVEGLTQKLTSYNFEWDLNGDGEVDQIVESDNTVTYIYDNPGIQTVKVRVIDDDSNEAVFTLDTLVKDISVTTADFDFAIDDKRVAFINESVVSANLSNKSLSYNWSFGDTDEDNYNAQKDQIGSENPTYRYLQPGIYVVTLTVVDSDQVKSTKTLDVVLEGELTAVDNKNNVNKSVKEAGKSGSLIGTIFKVILYIILIVIVLVLLIIVGLLAFLKVQNPDLVFEELIDELRIKLLSMMGVHDMIEDKPETLNPKDTTKSAPAPVSVPVPEPKADEVKPIPADSPKENVIEGEVVNVKPEAKNPVEKTPEPKQKPETPKTSDEGGPNLNTADGPVPDWLKKG